MKALVISGGGSKGAFAGGIAEYLIKECNNDYDIYVGSSTGSLIIFHLALGKVEKVKDLFTNITPKKIFNINPFRVKYVNGEPCVKINYINTLKSFLLRKPTFGESKNLRKLIAKSFTPIEFNELKKMNKELIITVSNLTKARVEFKSNLNCGYTDYIDWSWASANYVPFMSLVTKEGNQYADGGFGSHTPIQEAINRGATSIDVIVLEPEPKKIERNIAHSASAFESLMRVFSFMTDQIYKDDIVIGTLKGKVKDVGIRFFYTPRILTDFPLNFNERLMKKWWNDGYNHAKKVNPFCSIIEIPKDESTPKSKI